MSLEALVNKIKQFASEVSAGKQLTVYHYLFGIAKLVQMNPMMRDKVLFKAVKEQDCIKELQTILEEAGLNTKEKLEQLSALAQNVEQKESELELFDQLEQENGALNPVKMLQNILALDKEELKLLLQGENMAAHNNKLSFQSLMGRTRQLSQKLSERLNGQDEAIRQFVEGYFQSEILKDAGHSAVRASFLFGGPMGVGKATLAEAAADILNLPFMKVELSEYAAEDYAVELVGAVEGEANGSKLLSFVDKNPQCLLLFNELDKAHPKVLSALAKVLESGFVDTKALNKKVSFNAAILVFTTTLGESLYDADRESNVSVLPRAMIFDAFKRELARNPVAEALMAFIFNNFSGGNIIMFNFMSVHYLTDIVKSNFAAFVKQMQEVYDFQISIAPEITSIFLYSHCNALDARAASMQSVIFLENELYELGRHLKPDSDIFSRIKNIHFKIELPKLGDRLRALFTNEEKAQVLVIADKEQWPNLKDSAGCTLNFASSYTEAKEILKTKDILYCVIDLYYKQNQESLHFLSLDDIQSVGIECFEKLNRKLEDMPIFVLDKPDMDPEDQATFLQRGARAFVKLYDNALEELSQRIYMQKKVNQLTSKGKVLGYNTAQAISQDGQEVEITFYNFHTRNVQTMENMHLGLVGDMHPKARFNDIVGAKTAKRELQYLSEYLQNPHKFIIKEGKAPGGILLYGLPETGKASLAEALAGEGEATFIPISSNFLLSLTPQAATESINDIFMCGKQCAPSVIFLDDLEGVAHSKVPLIDTYKNLLLDNLDKISKDTRHPVLFVGAVDWGHSHISTQETGIDSTVLHRMEYKIFVNLPDKEERKAFLQKELADKGCGKVSEAAIHNLASRTPGMSVAMLKDVVALARRNAKRSNQELNDAIFMEALDEYEFGEKHEWNEAEYKDTAIHEAGHAYLTWKYGKHSSFITIISRGDFGGYTMPEINEKGESAPTKKRIIEEIRMLLAGRASEIVFLGQDMGTNSGISSDLQKATSYALRMICYYGMDDNSLVSLPPEIMLKSSLGGEIINRVSKLLQEELQNTIKIIEEGREAIQELVDALMDRNQLTGEEIDAIFDKYKEKV